jgi:SAM-dependent methyltransferase
METQYDAIGQSYERLKKQMPLARFPEQATLARLAARTGGADVLDLACGTGWYSRALASGGARSVHGVDISAEMVASARRTEAAEPRGITFTCADARSAGVLGEFDVVSAVWLLCYAESQADLTAMARTAYGNLRDGGEYIGIEMNPAFDWRREPATKYGLTHRALEEFDGGKRLEVTAHVEPEISFKAVFWTASPIVRAFLDAGFRSVEFAAPEVPEAAVAEFGADFWAEFLANPTILGLRARK